MKLSEFICPWCETHRLQYVNVCQRDSSGCLIGIKLACVAPMDNHDSGSCPDTTGACTTEAEADRYASELCSLAEADAV